MNFKRNQQLNFWMQVYNLGINEQTKSNEAKVTYQIIDAATNAVIFTKEQDSKDFGQHSDQLTVEKSLPMAGLQPGKYKVTIKINDAISKQEIANRRPLSWNSKSAPHQGYLTSDQETCGELVPKEDCQDAAKSPTRVMMRRLQFVSLVALMALAQRSRLRRFARDLCPGWFATPQVFRRSAQRFSCCGPI